MKTISNISLVLAAMAMLASCQSTQTICKDGKYCAKCKTTFVQVGPPSKTSSGMISKTTCPTCGGPLTSCTVCR